MSRTKNRTYLLPYARLLGHGQRRRETSVAAWLKRMQDVASKQRAQNAGDGVRDRDYDNVSTRVDA